MKRNEIAFPLLRGTADMFLISLLLAALAAALIQRGTIPPGGISGAAIIISAAAALLGAIRCGRAAKRARLPLCVGCGAIYLGVAFVVRGICFRSVGPAPWIMPAVAAAGCVAGALIASGGGKR